MTIPAPVAAHLRAQIDALPADANKQDALAYTMTRIFDRADIVRLGNALNVSRYPQRATKRDIADIVAAAILPLI